MAKQPAISTQLKTATARIAELEKKLAAETSSKDGWYKRHEDAKAELEQVHVLLDVLPGAAGRKTTTDESWNAREINAMTRLASYLASRGALAA
jgi:hypothetical protein